MDNKLIKIPTIEVIYWTAWILAMAFNWFYRSIVVENKLILLLWGTMVILDVLWAYITRTRGKVNELKKIVYGEERFWHHTPWDFNKILKSIKAYDLTVSSETLMYLRSGRRNMVYSSWSMLLFGYLLVLH